MNDVEKKFGESLRHHQVTPPPAVWDQLSANLAQKRKRRAVVYWRVAAAVTLLLLGTLTLVLFRSEPTGEKFAQREQPPASNQEELAEGLSDANPAGEANAAQEITPSGDASEASSALAKSVPVAKQDRTAPEESSPGSILAEQLPDSPTQLSDVRSTPQPERPRVAALPPMVPEAVNQAMPTVAVHKVSPPAAYQPDGLASRELAYSDSSLTTAGAQRRTITVIYKPGNQLSQPPADQDGGFLSKTLSFLEDVKNDGPTYSELRSAKSALINNVFSRDPAKQD